MVKKFKVEKSTGKVVHFSVKRVKRVLSTVGFTGKLLAVATNNVFKEAKKFVKGGVITSTNLEKAFVKSVSNTNKIAISAAQKLAKRVLK